MSKAKPPKAKPAKESKPVPVKSNRGMTWLIAGIIGLITLLVFSPALNHDFVNWDDDVNVTGNTNIRSLDAEHIHAMFTETVIGGYNPLTILSFAIEYKYFGLDSKAYHLTNVILHILCVLLVFVLLRQLGMNLIIAAIVALLFGIHPMRVESVAWVTERKDVLYSFFFLLAAITYIAWYKKRMLLLYIVSLLLFSLSLLSKIQAVSLPLALILFDYYFEGKFSLKQVLNKIPYFILSLMTGIAGIYFLKQQGSLETDSIMPLFQRLFIGTYSLLIYIIKSVVPWEMSTIYPFPNAIKWMHYISLPIVIGLGYLVWRIKKHRKILILGSLFFFVNVVFVLQIVGAGQGYIADRFTYIPYIGLFLILGYFIDQFAKGKKRIPVLILAGIAMVILGSVTVRHVRVWENTETLFTHVISRYPKVAVAHNNMGRYFRQQKDYDRAIASYTRAIEIAPEGHTTYCNRGKAYFDLGRTEEGLVDFNKCLELDSTYAEALSNRGAAYASKNMYTEAMVDLDNAIRLEPGHSAAYSNRSLLFYYMQDYQRAAEDATIYLRYRPNDADMINLRGVCYDNLQDRDRALADFNAAIRLRPEGAFYQNRSSLYNRIGEKQKAYDDILKAQEYGIKVNPEYLEAIKGE